MSTGTVRLRPGRLRDRPAIAAFTRHTFHWGDYIAQAWNTWVRDPKGKLIVAELDGEFAGTIRFASLGQGNGWIEGVRINPAFRRQGLAKFLVETAEEYARAARCTHIRLETYATNTPARALFESLGYRQVVGYTSWNAKSGTHARQGVRRARRDDFDALWALWQSSWLKRASRGILPASTGWRWWNFSAAHLRQAVRLGNAWVSPPDAPPRAFMLTREHDYFEVIAVVGARRYAMQLPDSARVMAHAAGKRFVQWLTPETPRAHLWAAAAGFENNEQGLLIYERRV